MFYNPTFFFLIYIYVFNQCIVFLAKLRQGLLDQSPLTDDLGGGGWALRTLDGLESLMKGEHKWCSLVQVVLVTPPVDLGSLAGM